MTVGRQSGPVRQTRREFCALFAAVGAAVLHGQSQPIQVESNSGPSAPDKTVFDLYLLMGQSNMVGRDTRDMYIPENPHVLAYDPNDHWIIARDPLHVKTGRTEPGVGPGITFAATMLAASPMRYIGLIPCAVGGTPLRRWIKGGDLYDAAVLRARHAAQYGEIQGVLWHQGESDSDKNDTADAYSSRLVGMFSDLRRDLCKPNLPIVVGQLGEFLESAKHPFADTVRSALRGIPAKLANTGFTDSNGLKDKGDHLHFDTPAQREFGTRFAAAMLKLRPAELKPSQ